MSTAESNGWAYASKIYAKSEEVIIDCEKCGARGRYPEKEFDIDIEGGEKYPDILLCGSYPLLIVSKKVVEDWKNEGITGFSFYPVGINSVSSESLRKVTPPSYFHIVVQGKSKLNLVKMEVDIVEKCPSCGKIKFNKPIWDIDKFYIDETTWDGLDLFVSDLFPTMILVTTNVVQSACKNKHTNFEFIKAEDSMQIIQNPINYLEFCKD